MVSTTVSAAVRATVSAAVGATVSAAVRATVSAAVGATVSAAVGATVSAAVGATVSAAVGATVSAAVGATVSQLVRRNEERGATRFCLPCGCFRKRATYGASGCICECNGGPKDAQPDPGLGHLFLKTRSCLCTLHMSVYQVRRFLVPPSLLLLLDSTPTTAIDATH